MPRPESSRWRDHRLWVELFALFNIAGLAGDIYLAHSMNFFRHGAEYVPLVLSLAAPALLVPALYFYWRAQPGPWALLGHIVGASCILVGVAGLMLHLESSFFQSRTLASLVYSAPFAAPLAYTGLGLLLVMNRTVEPLDPDWPRWVVLLALGGFIGNFVFSLTDHAQNGFYYRSEWIAVIAGALGVGFLSAALLRRPRRAEIVICGGVMLASAIVGLVGFWMHAAADLAATGAPLFSRVVYGAPILAPLLFTDMALLALIGLVVLHGMESPTGSSTLRSGASTE